MATNGAVSKVTTPNKISRGDFPSDFVFGAASAAYQYEGAAKEGGRGPCTWDVFTQQQPGKINDGANGNVAVDSYHRYKEDVQLLKKIGLDAYRFSISWSRVLPGGKLNMGVNKEGIKYYNDLIDELLKNGIEPYVTLFHWDLPNALEEEYKGFLSPLVIDDFRDYAELCFWEFGDRVKNWITHNEPWTYCHDGYATGSHPPARGGSGEEGKPGTEPYIAAHNLLLSHAAVVELYRQQFQASQQGKIGITLVSEWFEPLDPKSDSDVAAAKRGIDFMFGWFMEPITTGDYPQTMRDIVGSRLPKFTKEQSMQVKGSYDFLGLNYYTGTYTTNDPKPNTGVLSYSTDPQVTYATDRNGKLLGPQSGSTWLHIYPEGLYKLLVYIKETYNDPLIFVTENGVDEANDNTKTVTEARLDKDRIGYIHDHLVALLKAISDGVNVKSYFVWSLLDNFEWADGYSVRFGLIYVDYKNGLERYPKSSAIWFKDFLARGKLTSSSKKRAANDEDVGSTKKLKN